VKHSFTNLLAVAVDIIREGDNLCASAITHTNHVAFDVFYHTTPCFARKKKTPVFVIC
jgi:hypothetical protein